MNRLFAPKPKTTPPIIRQMRGTASASDLPDACIAGDSATVRRRPGRCATSWHGNKFLNPATDGAVLPILHLNGYKIANPTILARIPTES